MAKNRHEQLVIVERRSAKARKRSRRCARKAAHKVNKVFKSKADYDRFLMSPGGQMTISSRLIHEIRAMKGLCTRCRDDTKSLPNLRVCEDHWYKQLAISHFNSVSRWRELKQLMYDQNHRCPESRKKLIPGKNAAMDHKIPRARVYLLNGVDFNDISNIRFMDSKLNIQKSSHMTDSEFHTFRLVLRKLKKEGSKLSVAQIAEKLLSLFGLDKTRREVVRQLTQGVCNVR